jgi:metal-sulfur cluster biosynthetic enzyme
MILKKEAIEEALKTVMDPEIDLDVFTLGLIYNIEPREDGSVFIEHTFTSPACPLGPQIQANIVEAVKKIGATSVELEVTFDPPWEASQELRDMLGI